MASSIALQDDDMPKPRIWLLIQHSYFLVSASWGILQIDILRSMDHPHIVKAFEVYKYKKQIYLILQCCDGGDLYTRSPYSERQAAEMVTSLLSAISYMHEHKIVHRDVRRNFVWA